MENDSIIAMIVFMVEMVLCFNNFYFDDYTSPKQKYPISPNIYVILCTIGYFCK